MKLKATLENLDGLDEALKACYTEKDGKYFLNLEGYDPNEVEVLRSTMRRAKDEKKAAEIKLTELQERYSGLPDDFSVDEYNTMKDTTGGKGNQALIDLRARLTAEKDAAVKKERDEKELFKGQLETEAKENALKSAIAENNITLPYAVKAVKAMFKSDAKVEFEDGKPIVTIGNLPVSDVIKTYVGTDEGKNFVTAPGNGGGGSGGNNGGTGGPAYDKMTNTELTLIQDKDPRAKAEMDKRLKIEKPSQR